MSDPEKLVEIELYMMRKFHHFDYFKYLLFTLYGKGTGDRVKNS